MAIYFDEIDNKKDLENYYVVVQSRFDPSIIVSGLIDDEMFSYSASTQLGQSIFGSAVDALKKNVTQYMAGAINKFTKGIAGDAFGALADKFQTVGGTVRGFESPSLTPLTVTMHLFPNKHGNGSYKDIELALSKMTQGKEDWGVLQSCLYDPLSIFQSMSDGGDGFKGQLLHLSIGKWFAVDGDLFVESIQRNYSKYVDSNNKPIFLEVTINFTTYKAMSASEMASWIKV